MATWTEITADTPVNDVAVITEIHEALIERAKAAGYYELHYAALEALWPGVVQQSGLTVTGVHAGEEWQVEGEVHAVGDGSAGPYAGAATYPPVLPGSVTITAGEQTLTDDEAGNLLDVAENVVGHIAYPTGCTRFTFPAPVPDETPILIDYTRDCTTFTAGESVFAAGMVGHKMAVEGIGEFRLTSADGTTATAPGDGTCEDAEFSVSPAGTALDAAWWSALQGHIAALYPYFCESVDEDGVVMFAENAWLPRRVPILSPLDGVYDPEAETTALEYDTEEEGWFVEEMVGALIDVFGLGQFQIVSVEDTKNITVAGNAECGGRRFSVLPQDWSDAGDPAFSGGPVQAGDVLGPWLLADCQAGVKGLGRDTPALTGWGDADTGYTGVAVQGDEKASIPEAKADAEAKYAAAEMDADSTTPQAHTDLFEFIGQNPPNDNTFRGDIHRRAAFQSWAVPADAADIPRDINFYVVGWAYGTWNRNGDFPAEYVAGKLYLWSTAEGATGESGSSAARFGQLPPVVPSWGNPGGGVWDCGYTAGASAAICRWAFAYPAS